MATDYDAPRKTDEDTDSIQALQERVPDKLSGVVDVDDADNPGFELAGQDLADIDLDVVVLPPQAPSQREAPAAIAAASSSGRRVETSQ
mgnify:CR=1 FL=1